MWVRSAAIRPVPLHAQLPAEALADVEDYLGGDERATEDRLNETFEAFEQRQPVLSEYLGEILARRDDDIAVALGYFLGLAIWRAFDSEHGSKLATLDTTAIESVDEALTLDEELRGADPEEAVESDDVVAMEQPHALAFIHEHVDAALEVHAEVDVDDVHAVYRALLVVVLALSYAVAPPADQVGQTSEMYA
ncbi:MAG: hypothetical protein KC731_25805 [Myxococcales bacterium]|nr:hypothetical protein [Myxococcales bacterium]